MKNNLIFSCIVLVAILSLQSRSSLAQTPEQVRFPSLDNWNGTQPLMLDGYLFKPANKERYAVVTMFHGCAGALSKKGKITKRFSDMAGLLVDMGYAVLLVDSFNPRGTREICTTPPKQRTIFSKQRWLDAYGALTYLNTRTDVIAGKIAAIGFSHGGTNALQIMDANLPAYAASGKGFAASVAMYPGCTEVLRQRPQFKVYAPLLVLVGELDDWTPAERCRELAERSRNLGEPVEYVSYPNSYHGFDETTPVHVRTDVTHGVNGRAGVHVGGNPEAREQAYTRIREFFAAQLGQ